MALEALGFCQEGEGGAFVSGQRTAPGGAFPMNTNGGGLSYTHSGMYGMFTLVEAVRQLRRECGPRQVARGRNGLCHGLRGLFSAAGSPSGGTEDPRCPRRPASPTPIPAARAPAPSAPRF